jgi:hypothetical protein
MLSLPEMMGPGSGAAPGQVGPIERSVPWIAAAAVASLWFIVVLGRGITWSR